VRRGGGTGWPESRLEHWVAEPAWLPVVSRMRVRCMSEMGVSGRSVLLLLLQRNGDAWTSPGAIMRTSRHSLDIVNIVNPGMYS
jgi:hypothetical protein